MNIKKIKTIIMAYFTYKLENGFEINLDYQEFRHLNALVGAEIKKTKPENQELHWHDRVREKVISDYIKKQTNETK